MHLKLSQSASARLPDGTEVTLTDLDAALLAWLALEGPTARNRLAALLWPGSSAEAAGNSLRQRLFRLKRQCGMAPVVGTGVLALAEGVNHDLLDAGDVLGGVQMEFGPEFADWLRRQRSRRTDRLRQSLTELADMAEQARDFGDAMQHAQELLALEPLSEAAHRRVIVLAGPAENMVDNNILEERRSAATETSLKARRAHERFQVWERPHTFGIRSLISSRATH